MVQSKSTNSRPGQAKQRMTLTVSRPNAERQIATQVKEGENLLARKSTISDYDLQQLRDDAQTWREKTRALLEHAFTSDEFAGEFSQLPSSHVHVNMSTIEKWQSERDDLAEYVRRLKSITHRLQFVEEPPISSTSHPSATHVSAEASKAVFLVHGHNNAVKETVARFLEKLGLHVIILHEQPNKGETVIEKFEANSDVGFAVVLLTPDDVGEIASASDKLNPRARQNVIFELGYFTGKLGRARVCTLYIEGVEIPSDFKGVLYVPYDASDGWRLKLAAELKTAGMKVNLNRAV
jgi:predicted nucleotide-binding protein